MNIIFPALAVAFAAFSVGLGVRVFNRRKRPGWRFWLTVTLIALLTGYPLSFGPACWLATHGYDGTQTIKSLYLPILWIYRQNHSPFVSDMIYGYSWIWTGGKLWIPDDDGTFLAL